MWFSVFGFRLKEIIANNIGLKMALTHPLLCIKRAFSLKIIIVGLIIFPNIIREAWNRQKIVEIAYAATRGINEEVF